VTTARSVALPIVWVTAANLAGALASWLYGTYIDVSLRTETVGMRLATAVYFVIGFAVIAALVITVGRRWAGPVIQDGPALDDPVVRRRAVALPWIFTAVSAGGWLLASVVWGVVWPALLGHASLARFLRTFVAVSLIGGSVTAVFTYLAIEHRWRRHLPRFFPRGDVTAVRGVPRLSVRTRLLVAFLLVGLLPLGLMAALTLGRAQLMIGADPVTATGLLHDMTVLIVFLFVVGAATAVALAVFVSPSVAGPLADLERAMEHVGRGDLETRCPVVSNDELGTVAEGFNRMVAGLQERERIREAFGKYVSPEVRDEILAGRVELAGQVREVTILFSDLRDFTPWVESRPPTEVVRDLNAYFTLMEGAIRGHGGLVLQFIGDEIEAVFGAPVAAPDHADRALHAALEMRRRLDTWNAARAGGGVSLAHGIGVHSGPVLAGNIGSPDRLSYALVGDAVNLASRLQSLTRELGGQILVSGDTVRRLKGSFALEALPAVHVKGRAADVEVYRAA
jgi:class 3 adenylate cyclase